MRPSQSTDATEKRRQLLKGALGASTVVTLGYSGTATAAAASITACIANSSGLVPTVQFVNNNDDYEPFPLSSGAEGFAWKRVYVSQYAEKVDGSGQNFYAADIDGTLYEVAERGTGPLVVPFKTRTGYPPKQGQPAGFKRTAWSLAYFDERSKAEYGLYPNVTTAGDGVAPASLQCLNSLNADLAGDYKFGG